MLALLFFLIHPGHSTSFPPLGPFPADCPSIYAGRMVSFVYFVIGRYLTNNKLTTYPAKALSSQTLSEISLTDNEIATLPDDPFAGQSSVKKL